MVADYDNYRTVATLEEVVALRLKIRRCHNRDCPRYHQPYRPEEEGRIALPEHEFGLDVIALVGTLRYGSHRRVPEIHLGLLGRGLVICQRSVTNLLDRYDELVALSLADKIPPHLHIDKDQLRSAPGTDQTQRKVTIDMQIVTPENAKELYFAESVYWKPIAACGLANQAALIC